MQRTLTRLQLDADPVSLGILPFPAMDANANRQKLELRASVTATWQRLTRACRCLQPASVRPTDAGWPSQKSVILVPTRRIRIWLAQVFASRSDRRTASYYLSSLLATAVHWRGTAGAVALPTWTTSVSRQSARKTPEHRGSSLLPSNSAGRSSASRRTSCVAAFQSLNRFIDLMTVRAATSISVSEWSRSSGFPVVDSRHRFVGILPQRPRIAY